MIGAGEPQWLVRVRIVLFIELACSPSLLQPTTWAALVPTFKGTWLGSRPLVKVVTPLLRAVPQIV